MKRIAIALTFVVLAGISVSAVTLPKKSDLHNTVFALGEQLKRDKILSGPKLTFFLKVIEKTYVATPKLRATSKKDISKIISVDAVRQVIKRWPAMRPQKQAQIALAFGYALSKGKTGSDLLTEETEPLDYNELGQVQTIETHQAQQGTMGNGQITELKVSTKVICNIIYIYADAKHLRSEDAAILGKSIKKLIAAGFRGPVLTGLIVTIDEQMANGGKAADLAAEYSKKAIDLRKSGKEEAIAKTLVPVIGRRGSSR